MHRPADQTTRPRSIKELAEASQFAFDESFSLMSYVRGAESLRRQATAYEREHDYETAFVLLTRSAKLALDHIPRHRDFGKADKNVTSQLVHTSKLSMEDMKRLKPRLKERYEQWKMTSKSESVDQTAPPMTSQNSSSSTPYIPYTPPPDTSSGKATFVQAPLPARTYSAFHTPFIPYTPPPAFPLPSVSQPISYPKIPSSSSDRHSQQSSAGIGGFHKPSQNRTDSLPPAPQPLQPRHATQTAAALQPSWTEGGMPLRNMVLPASMMETFAAVALPNTKRNLETCGLIVGRLSRNVFTAVALVIPKQTATSDSCTMIDEEDIVSVTGPEDIVLGWIHTHPRQTCFLSSLDLHTHHSYQQMLPEAIAIVIAPTASPSIGIFRMTDPLGLQVIASCPAKPGSFHPHPDLPIYTDANGMHVTLDTRLCISVIDIR